MIGRTARRLRARRGGSRGRLLVASVLVGLLLVGLLVGVLAPGGLGFRLQQVLAALHGAGRAGVVGFAVLQVAIAASGVLPAALIGLAAGAVYGIPLGFTLAATSTMVGAWLAFRLSRSLFRPRIEQVLARRPRLADLDCGLARERWRLVCLLRVSPVMPFAATSYTLGLSAVTERDYLLGTLAAMPALLGYVCLGRLAHAGLTAGSAGAGPFQWVLLGVGGVATAALTLRVGQLVARSLARPGLPVPTAGALGAEQS